MSRSDCNVDGGWLPLNQSNLDNVIGRANYDTGHLFTTETAGRAMLRSVCNGTSKEPGVTGISTPTGDNFDVDFVSHEIEHQSCLADSAVLLSPISGPRSGDRAPSHVRPFVGEVDDTGRKAIYLWKYLAKRALGAPMLLQLCENFTGPCSVVLNFGVAAVCWSKPTREGQNECSLLGNPNCTR
jgi:hypothetical protein